MTQNENLNTAQLLESTKINKPLVYKVLSNYDALDNNTKPELMSEMIYAIELALWGDKEYAEIVDFSIFEPEELEELISQTKDTLKRMSLNKNKVSKNEQEIFESMTQTLANHIKKLETTASSKAKQKQ